MTRAGEPLTAAVLARWAGCDRYEAIRQAEALHAEVARLNTAIGSLHGQVAGLREENTTLRSTLVAALTTAADGIDVERDGDALIVFDHIMQTGEAVPDAWTDDDVTELAGQADRTALVWRAALAHRTHERHEQEPVPAAPPPGGARIPLTDPADAVLATAEGHPLPTHTEETP